MKHSSQTANRAILEDFYENQRMEADLREVSPEYLKQEGKSVLIILLSPFRAARYDLPSAVFVLWAMVSGLLCRIIIAGNPFDLKAFFADFAVFSLFTAIGYGLSIRRRIYYYIGITLFFAFFLFADGLYYRAHNSVLSFFLLSQLQFLPEVAYACRVLLDWKDLFFALLAIASVLTLVWLKRRGHFESSVEPRNLRIRKFLTNLSFALIILAVFGINLTNRDASRLVKQWNRPYIVERFGPYGYHVSDFIKFAASFDTVATIDESDYRRVLNYFTDRMHKPKKMNQYTGVLNGQNLIVIHAESLQRMFMFRTINGVEITPNLNRIAEQSLLFDNFYAQNSIGTSSDSEFTFLTSLYPINRGTVFISHDQRSFETLPKKLREKGYTTISMHGNNGSFWNRTIMNKQLGYQEFYSKKDFEIDEVLGMGLSDMSFFRQSLDLIHRTPQPFMTTLITLTNHTPFDETAKYGEFDSGIMEGTKTGNYMKSLHYMDKAIGYFFNELKQSGLLENSTFLVYGDHPASLERKEIKKLLGAEKFDRYDHRLNKTVPLIIWSKQLPNPRRIQQPMGMIDVFPTLANMLGIENPYCLGNDIFSTTVNRVVFPDGSWIDENALFLANKSKFKLHNEDFIENELKSRCITYVQNENTQDAAPADVLTQEYEIALCNHPSTKRVFKYRADKPNMSGLAKYAYPYIHTRTQEAFNQLEISSHVLAFDLLHHCTEEHPHSLLSLAKN